MSNPTLQEQDVSTDNEEQERWQPVVMILDRRLECQCGALAIFVSGKISDDGYNQLDAVDCWCQDCYTRAQKELDRDA